MDCKCLACIEQILKLHEARKRSEEDIKILTQKLEATNALVELLRARKIS